MTDPELVNTLVELSRVLLEERSLGASLASIAQAAVDTVPGCDAASVALAISGRAATAAISGRIALEVDLMQYDTEEGPCLQSLHTGEKIRIDIIEEGDRFPHFARAAGEVGITSVLSMPAVADGTTVGTLNLYSRGRGFDLTSETVAALLASQVAVAIARSPEYAAAGEAADQAQRVADEQATVSIASGILMSLEQCSAEQAEGLLQRAAVDDEQTIVEIARRVIAHLRDRDDGGMESSD